MDFAGTLVQFMVASRTLAPKCAADPVSRSTWAARWSHSQRSRRKRPWAPVRAPQSAHLAGWAGGAAARHAQAIRKLRCVQDRRRTAQSRLTYFSKASRPSQRNAQTKHVFVQMQSHPIRQLFPHRTSPLKGQKKKVAIVGGGLSGNQRRNKRTRTTGIPGCSEDLLWSTSLASVPICSVWPLFQITIPGIQTKGLVHS